MLSPLSLPDDVIVVDTQPLTSASPIRRVFDRTRLGTSLSLSLSLSLSITLYVSICVYLPVCSFISDLDRLKVVSWMNCSSVGRCCMLQA